jgi:protein LSM14
MAKLESGTSASAGGRPPQSNGGGVDNLTKKVNEMRVNARGGAHGSHGGRGGGRGRGLRPSKVEVPESDFDFASSNAKFNKEDVAKEAIAGSPIAEPSVNTPEESSDGVPTAYNKTRSFFDDISSESKERRENKEQKQGGREWRGEEQRKNIETFGQGSVDNGHRNYRGRGRGRGGRGRGYRGGSRGGGFRGNSDQQQTVS